MNKLNPSALFNKALEKLQQDPNWKVIANNSVVTSLIKSNAEIMAETARYAEYLYNESKWNTAQNASSILAMANMLGYQPKRKISARGKIYVSVDPRTHMVGNEISSNMFKELTPESASFVDPAWMLPQDDISITPSCTITDSRGNSYIASPTVFSKNKYWAIVDIMQGKRKSAFVDINTIRNTMTVSKLDPYLYIPVTITNCENADNSLSKAFLKVYVARAKTVNGKETITYTEYRTVNSLLFSDYTDRDVEVYNDLYSQELFYLKFNNDTSRGQVLDISQNSDIIGIRIDYVETTGFDSNVTELFEKFTLTDLKYTNTLNTAAVTLYGTNFAPIVGGADEETVQEIRVNAPKFYITNYTSGTREAYENTILNMDFVITTDNSTQPIRPKKVKVYGGTIEQDGIKQPVTCITFLADGLEDLSTYSSDKSNPYESIEDALKTYLAKLKSPQDTLKFVAPNYVPFALGLKCLISRTQIDENSSDPVELENNIMNLIDERWGSSSNFLDFGRSFLPSNITTAIENSFSSIATGGTEAVVEAVKKLNWNLSTRIDPTNSEAPTAVHTFRIPYSFNNVFLGTHPDKGFKDFRIGASYVMRIDFMYKKPNSLTTAQKFHSSLFLEENKTGREHEAFYLKQDSAESRIWPEGFTEFDKYTELNSSQTSVLDRSWQFEYKDQIYDDSDFNQLIDNGQKSYDKEKSAIPIPLDNYLIYYSANYDTPTPTSDIGQGWVEFPFDSFYQILSFFSLYDATLKAELNRCPLSILKCGNEATAADAFNTFIDIAKDYIDIYVSMRPTDNNLQLSSTDDTGSAVLYIDSADTYASATSTKNLTADKRPRMISISCSPEKSK